MFFYILKEESEQNDIMGIKWKKFKKKPLAL